MAKQEKEIERWVTVNGVRVPIFKDGSVGGPKALADKIKKSGKKESKNKDDGSKQRLSTYERQLAEVNDELANAPKSKALRNEEGIKELEKKKAQLEGYIAKEKKSKQIDKDNDLKEKQIAKNQAEVDERNGKSIKLSKEDEKATSEYIKNNDWVHEQVNRELESGKDWDTVMAQVNNARKTAERDRLNGKDTKTTSKRFKKSDYEKSEKYIDTITSKRDFNTGEAVGGPSAINQVSDRLEKDFGPLHSNSHYYDSDFRSETYYTQLKDKSGRVVAIQRDRHDRWKNESDAILTDYGKQVLSNKSKSIKETHDSQLIKNAKAGNISNPSKLFMPELKTLAKEFGIDPTGKSKEELANIIGSILKKRK